MKIEWTVKKKVGHLRPKLHYGITLDAFEIELAVPMVRITSTIPKPPDAGQHYVWPGTKECGREEPTDVYDLYTPSHKTGQCKEILMLPMRKDSDYPEVEASFRHLRRVFENALLAAYANSAFEIRGHLDLTTKTKQRIAPEVAAARFLAVVEKAS
jgi:hypothetical protein